jgi:RNA recognition motif-containing protein
VQFKTREGATKAIKILNKKLIHGREIVCRFATVKVGVQKEYISLAQMDGPAVFGGGSSETPTVLTAQARAQAQIEAIKRKLGALQEEASLQQTKKKEKKEKETEKKRGDCGSVSSLQHQHICPSGRRKSEYPE